MNLRVLASRIRGLFVRRELDEEIATHISLMAAEYERRGMSQKDALAAARRDFGGVTQMREAYRDQQRLPSFDSLFQDLSYALRQMRKSKVFSAAAVVTLALGIGANMAVFRALDAVLLRSLPVRHARDLVYLQPLDFGKPANFDYRVYQQLTGHQQVFSDMFAAGGIWPQDVLLPGGAKIKVEDVRVVTGGYFRILGVNAAIGRLLSEDDDRADAPAAAVLSYRLWERQFGAAPDAIGKLLKVDGVPVTIVGVAPREFLGERIFFEPDLWVPIRLQPSIVKQDWLRDVTFNFLDVFAIRRPGVSMAQAQKAVEPLYVRIQNHKEGEDRLLVVSGRHGILFKEVREQVVDPLRLLMWMVAAVLTIACCNLANLLLARGASRSHEVGVRLAMGAGRGRLVRQLLTESLLIAGLGTVLGFAVAEWGGRMLANWADLGDIKITMDLDWEVLAFVVGVSIAATCIFGMGPALAGTRIDIRSALQGSHRAPGGGQPRQYLGKAFVVAQVSICLMLLAGAALLARSLWNLQQQDWGFESEKLLIAQFPVDMPAFLDPTRLKAPETWQRQLIARLSAVPGVRSAALVSGGPLGSLSMAHGVAMPGRPAKVDEQAGVVTVSSRYFESMGIPIVSGRPINEADHAKAARVAVINQSAAHRYFGGADPIGRYICFDEFDQSKAMQIVGVSRDVRFSNPRENAGPVIFVPLAQQPAQVNSLVLRTQGNPAAVADLVRAAVREVNPDMSLGSIRPASELIDEQLAGPESMAVLSAGFGLLALIMAAVGLYGVITYAVARRTQEIGIRIALGASGDQVKALVMRDVAVLVMAGLVTGAAASAACIRVVRSVLFGITARDGGWVLLAILVLAFVAAAAGYLPARRAARLDPMEALRQE